MLGSRSYQTVGSWRVLTMRFAPLLLASAFAMLPLSGPQAATIDVGSSAACAVRDFGVQCWGTNTSGVLGNTSIPASQYFPDWVPGLERDLDKPATAVSVGSDSACAIKGGA